MDELHDNEGNRIFSVIEYLANQEQIGQGTAKVCGSIRGTSEANCCIGDWTECVRFDSGDLPEGDRIKILECGFAGKPGTNAVVKIDFKTNHATEIEFREE